MRVFLLMLLLLVVLILLLLFIVPALSFAMVAGGGVDNVTTVW